MSKQNFIRITLFVSVLVFNPAFADTFRIATNIQSSYKTTVVDDIASVLYERGLEEKAARERAANLVGEDAELFALMLDTFLHECSDISREELLAHLGTAALHRQKISLDSYAHLIDLYTKIKRTTPDDKVRSRLSAVAGSNRMMLG
jgi:hypothetical protein